MYQGYIFIVIKSNTVQNIREFRSSLILEFPRVYYYIFQYRQHIRRYHGYGYMLYLHGAGLRTTELRLETRLPLFYFLRVANNRGHFFVGRRMTSPGTIERLVCQCFLNTVCPSKHITEIMFLYRSC